MSESGDVALPGTPAPGATLGKGLVRAEDEARVIVAPPRDKPPFRDLW